MKRDFRQSTNSAAGGVLRSPVLLSQLFGRFLERRIPAEQERCNPEPKFGTGENFQEDDYKAREWSNSLLQFSLDEAVVLSNSVGQFPEESCALSPQIRFFQLIRRAIAESLDTLRGFCAARVSEGRLERVLADVIRELPPPTSVFQAIATGKSRALKPEIHEQVCHIGQEALVNAIRHSQATLIEVEVEYRHRNLRLVIRDNGCGIDPEAFRASGNSHGGLLQMDEKARVVGAQLHIWSRRGLGTEVEVLLPEYSAFDNAA